MNATDVELVMWEGSVRELPYEKQVEAASHAGFSGLALTPMAFQTAIDFHGTAGTRRLAEQAGLTLHLDTATGWAPIRVPTGADDYQKARFDVNADDCFALIDALSLRSVLAVAVFDHGAVPEADLVQGFGEFADRAAERSVPVNLEFMPFWGVPDLAAAWSIVEKANRPGTGLMLDTWHFAHSGADLELLSRIPDEVPIHLQLADGTMAPAGADLITATMHTRRPPGQGSLEILGVISAVTHRSPRITAGPEVFSDDLDRLDAKQIGEILGASTREVLFETPGGFPGAVTAPTESPTDN
ncbi:sugar phosphate isomerase/epimerase family protein [Pseudoclavibacter terrae]|uniref:sugar phosphate isomerase/epimerase family protein n=1 Tax=Pseudoclavibacter terrae TaxID=1530195 RepID=UPI00232D005D|nr:sugar phosphate isomerase/epimerase [Pseudoclavibacter terrae]